MDIYGNLKGKKIDRYVVSIRKKGERAENRAINEENWMRNEGDMKDIVFGEVNPESQVLNFIFGYY